MEAREATTIFYQTVPTPETATVTVTSIVTARPSASPLDTVTYGRPWTTATPYEYTRRFSGTTQVVQHYPYQPPTGGMHHYYRECRGGAFSAAYFAGFGTVLIILVLIALGAFARKIVKRRGERRALNRPMGGADSTLSTPRGKAPIQLGEEETPLMGEETPNSPKSAENQA